MKKSGVPNFIIILILGALSTVSPFAIDMYLPAFDPMAEALHTTPARIALSLSSYFVGLSFGQIFYGPLLDRFGRKRPLYAGLSLFILACYACSTSQNVESLIAFRFFQALGGCSAQVAAFAMVRDFFPLKEAPRVLSLLVLILGVSPLFAPTLGGFVVASFGWQAVFSLLACIVFLILLFCIFVLPEGHEPDPTFSLKLRPLLNEFASIARTPQFHTYVLAGAFSFSGLFVYVAASPLIFMNIYQVSAPVYGAIFAGLSVGFIGSSQVNIVLSRWYRPEQIFRTAVFCQVGVSLVFVLASSSGFCRLPVALTLLALNLSCVGLLNPNATALALAPFSRNAGSASALLGFTQMGVGALASAAVGFLGASGLLPITLIWLGTSAVALAIVIPGQRKLGPALAHSSQHET